MLSFGKAVFTKRPTVDVGTLPSLVWQRSCIGKKTHAKVMIPYQIFNIMIIKLL